MAPSSSRTSPLVRRLLREAGLSVEAVRGTGAGGRVLPNDVRAADGPSRSGPTGSDTGRSGDGRLSPLVRRLLRDAGLTTDDVVGTGRGGRLLPADVRRISATPGTGDVSRVRTAPEVGTPIGVTALTPGRRATAAWTTTVLASSAQLTAAREVDVTALVGACERAAADFLARNGVTLTPLALVARAACRTLARHPSLNSTLDAEAGTVTMHGAVDIAIEVPGPDGPTFPVIDGADDLNTIGLARRLGHARLTGGPAPDALQPPATFTLTDVGSDVVILLTPLLRPGQAATLAVPRIEGRPVIASTPAGDLTIAVRRCVTLCLTYDHRIVDGADAARFLADLAADLERDRWDDELDGPVTDRGGWTT